MERNDIYAKELRIVRRMAQWANRHNHIVNALLAAQVAYMLYYIYMHG